MNESALHGLYAITDPGLLGDTALFRGVEEAIAGGARLVQYRNKSASANRRHLEASMLSGLCRRHGVPLIVNDDVALAASVGAQGVHLGENDAPVDYARAVLGNTAIVGISCYNDLFRAETAVARGADYVAFGSLFPSPTKPSARHADLDLIREASAILPVPVCGIGGITAANAAAVIEAGAAMVAVISDLFTRGDPRAAAEAIARLFS